MSNPQVEKALLQSQDAFYHASVKKDSVYMASALHDKFVFTSPRAVFMNKQSFTADFVANPAVQMDIFESAQADVVIVGTTAVVSGSARAKFSGKDPFNVRTTTVFVQANSVWQILAFHETFIP